MTSGSSARFFIVPLPEAPPRPRRIMGIGNALRLWIENGETVLASKLMHKSRDIISLGPHASHDNVSRRAVQSATPRAIIVVVNSIFGNGVNLGVLGGKLGVERVNGRMWLNTSDVAFAETMIKLDRFPIGEARMREPNAKIAAHKFSTVPLSKPTGSNITYVL